MNDQQLEQWWMASGYRMVRKLPDGTWIGIMPLMFTYALCVGLDRWGYARRYCYSTYTDVHNAFEAWSGEGDPPGAWSREPNHYRLLE